MSPAAISLLTLVHARALRSLDKIYAIRKRNRRPTFLIQKEQQLLHIISLIEYAFSLQGVNS